MKDMEHEYYMQVGKLQEENDRLRNENVRLTKKLALLEDAVLVYHEHRLPDKQWQPIPPATCCSTTNDNWEGLNQGN